MLPAPAYKIFVVAWSWRLRGPPANQADMRAAHRGPVTDHNTHRWQRLNLALSANARPTGGQNTGFVG
jgi:hypothetical protein